MRSLRETWLTPANQQVILIVSGTLLAWRAPYLGIPFALVVLLPIAVAIQLGISRDRSGWMWGLFLSWLGVLILACMRPQPKSQLERRTATKPWER